MAMLIIEIDEDFFFEETERAKEASIKKISYISPKMFKSGETNKQKDNREILSIYFLR